MAAIRTREKLPEKLRLSKHFKEKWAERYGREPRVEEIREVIAASAWASKCRYIDYKVNCPPYRVLAIYVNFTVKVAIKVDVIAGIVVTFVDARDASEARRKQRGTA